MIKQVIGQGNLGKELAVRTAIIRLTSTVGAGTKDVFVDGLQSGTNFYIQILALTQQQDGGIGANVFAFLCDPTMNFGQDPTDPTSGQLLPTRVGPKIGSDGSVVPNYGDMLGNDFGTAAQGIRIPPKGWFLRFSTSSPAFPVSGTFRIVVQYVELPVDECEL